MKHVRATGTICSVGCRVALKERAVLLNAGVVLWVLALASEPIRRVGAHGIICVRVATLLHFHFIGVLCELRVFRVIVVREIPGCHSLSAVLP